MSVTGTVTIIIASENFEHCPDCGKELFEAPVETINGPEYAVKVCASCRLAWPIVED